MQDLPATREEQNRDTRESNSGVLTTFVVKRIEVGPVREQVTEARASGPLIAITLRGLCGPFGAGPC